MAEEEQIDYQLKTEKIDATPKDKDGKITGAFAERIAYVLYRESQIVKVWWDIFPFPEEVREFIKAGYGK